VNSLASAIQTLGLPVEAAELLGAIVLVVLGSAGAFMLLPHGHAHARPARVHLVGGVLVALSFAIMASFWHPAGPVVVRFFFYVFGLAAVASGLLMVTSPNPVHGALWFASVVLSTAGLFLLAGAAFLAAGTVIVYAGAIIVTFLFVIMLAQSQGLAVYDRTARSPRAAVFCSFLMLFGLLYVVLVLRTPSSFNQKQFSASVPKQSRIRSLKDRAAAGYSFTRGSTRAGVLTDANRSTAWLPEARPAAARPPHVASLGATLYTDHLIAAELAGVLLFVALVGAVAIAAPKPQDARKRSTS
jgi:NADH-quinone oxidoreductase subunit J